MDIKQAILEKVEIKNTTGLSSLISQNLSSQKRLNSMDLDQAVVELKIQHFLRGLRPLVSEYKAKEGMDAIVTIIRTLFEQWGYEFGPEECFVLYHMKDFGKFRIKDDKFYNDLQTEWSKFNEYRIEKNELKQILTDFKNLKFLEYRRGTIIFGLMVVLR